jgi:peptidylprolyl isomerase
MSKIKDGSTVQVHYKGTLQDDSVFDNSNGREPLEFTIGSKQVIPGFENAIVEMEVGETKTITIEKENAYGEVRNDLIAKVPKEQLPPDMEVETGQMLQFTQPNGQTMPVHVIEVDAESITVDANHPLAGETLTFEITLVSIK